MLGLADQILQRLRSGRLPRSADVRIFTRRGTGFPCACCGAAIAANELEYEIDAAPLDADSLCVMHAACYEVWFGVLRGLQLERSRKDRANTAIGSAGVRT
jgi:hypothetical protein